MARLTHPRTRDLPVCWIYNLPKPRPSHQDGWEHLDGIFLRLSSPSWEREQGLVVHKAQVLSIVNLQQEEVTTSSCSTELCDIVRGLSVTELCNIL